MGKLKWDQVGERLYETGTSKGVLFKQEETGAYGTGVAWNGLSAVAQSPDGAEENPVYADNIKYLALTSEENFKGSISAFTYPDEFAECDGSAELATGLYAGQQRRAAFGMAYSTVIGNDTMGNSYGEKIHVIYGARVTPTERSYESINETPNALTFSWDFTTTPEHVDAAGVKPTSHLTIDSTKVTPEVLQAVKDALYGTDAEEASLPSVDEMIALVAASQPAD